MDAPSLDDPASRTYPGNMICRKYGITHYENLAKLDQVAGKRFAVSGFPLRIHLGKGPPVRAEAVLEDYCGFQSNVFQSSSTISAISKSLAVIPPAEWVTKRTAMLV